MKAMQLASLLVSIILAPVLILGSLALVFTGYYLAIAILIPTIITFTSGGNHSLANLGILTNFALLCLAVYIFVVGLGPSAFVIGTIALISACANMLTLQLGKKV